MPVINPIYYLANRGGIPRIETTGGTVTTTAVTYTFSSDVSFSQNYNGIVLVKINHSIPSDTTTTLPVYFSSTNGGTKAVTKYNDDSLTVADLSGTGIYLIYYGNGKIQIL